MKTLPERCFRVVRAMAQTLFETEVPVPEERLDWLMRDLRDVYAHFGALTLLVFRISLALVQFAPLLLLGRPRRFTRLRAADRTRVLDAVEGSWLTLPYVAVKFYLCMVYFEHPWALARTGYDGRPLLASGAARPPAAPPADSAGAPS